MTSSWTCGFFFVGLDWLDFEGFAVVFEATLAGFLSEPPGFFADATLGFDGSFFTDFLSLVLADFPVPSGFDFAG